MAAYKRTDPKKLAQDREGIMRSLDEIEGRLHPDEEDSESIARRRKKYDIPPSLGGAVTGFKKNNSAV